MHYLGKDPVKGCKKSKVKQKINNNNNNDNKSIICYNFAT